MKEETTLSTYRAAQIILAATKNGFIADFNEPLVEVELEAEEYLLKRFTPTHIHLPLDELGSGRQSFIYVDDNGYEFSSSGQITDWSNVDDEGRVVYYEACDSRGAPFALYDTVE